MRVLRGTLAAAFATFVAAFSHVSAGGTMPHPGAVALSFALSLLVCIALVGREVSLWRTAASVGLSQILFHTLFSTLGTSADMTMTQTVGHHGAIVTTITDASAHTSTGHDGWMWAAHALAAVITTVALRHGEAAFWGLRSTAVLLFGSLVATITAVRLSPVARPARADWSRTELPRDLKVLFAALRHRGPPLQLAP